MAEAESPGDGDDVLEQILAISPDDVGERDATPDDLAALLEESYDDPLFFFEDVLLVRPRKWQREVLAMIRDRRMAGELHTKVHVRAAHASGKGWLAAGLVCWWQSTRPNARTLTTAPNWRDVEQLLWTEIRALYSHSYLAAPIPLGRMLNTEWKCGGDDPRFAHWFATGASSDHPENLEGQHSPVAAARFVDEAKAVDDGVFVATEGLLSAPESFDCWISTPGTREGRFYRRDLNAGDDLIRYVVTIDDLVADGVPGAKEWKLNAIEEYGGVESFEYQARAMANYIDETEGALFPFSWIERAMMTDTERTKRDIAIWHVAGLATLGYDVAGSADGDENVTIPCYGPDHELRYECGALDHWKQHDTMVSKDRALNRLRDLKGRSIRGDVQGLGKGVLDAIARDIHERSLGFAVEEYRAADPPKDPDRFVNRKAEDGWHVRMAMEKDHVRLPYDAKLREQMAAMKYDVKNGKIKLVDPNDSPDRWDAVLIAIGGGFVPLKPSDVYGDAPAAWGPDPRLSGWATGSKGW